MFTTQHQISDYPNGTLRLIKPAQAHATLSLKWLQDPEVGRHMGADFSDVSLATEEKRIHDLLTGEDTISWMIELDGQVIGNVEINTIKETSAEYGVKAGRFSTLIGEKSHWGKRISPTVKRTVMDWGFTDGGFELFAAKVLPENERSWRSLERLGFELGDTTSETDDGVTRQWRIYVMTKPQWQQLNRRDAR